MFRYGRKATAMLAIVYVCRKSLRVFAFVARRLIKCRAVQLVHVHLLRCVHREARPTLVLRVVRVSLASTLFAAIANKVDAKLTLTTLNTKVGLASRWTQRNRCTCTNWTARHFINRLATKANTLNDFLHTYTIASIAVAFLPYLNIHRDLAV